MHFLNSLRWFVQFLTTDKKSIKTFGVSDLKYVLFKQSISMNFKQLHFSFIIKLYIFLMYILYFKMLWLEIISFSTLNDVK